METCVENISQNSVINYKIMLTSLLSLILGGGLRGSAPSVRDFRKPPRVVNYGFFGHFERSYT